ncbi:agmatine deiminase family protein [Phototrophicus methaneseepsis]|uniref:Agmatine deiminase family protein n=1 Tax=Phototrophicus methaneseepsis TaxID=2710758 RepID=A0A7S8IFT1_9CHLR|nr:agmatine deiminase family protein [Phototrophicus methaneseepsis]QPC83263.1 agmatine deiminase family protein [Phototrophicus methaneseepsis]
MSPLYDEACPVPQKPVGFERIIHCETMGRMKLSDFLRFEYVIYPLWRRDVPPWARSLAEWALGRTLPAYIDRHPPQYPAEIARYLADEGIIPGGDPNDIMTLLNNAPSPATADLSARAPAHDGSPVRIPAQWEHTERVLMSWGTIYPPLWPMHAQMAEAISQVAEVEILVTSELWARAIWAYLQQRGQANMAHITPLILPTNDIWIRDYGPIMGEAADGHKVALNPVYAVLPQYPQSLDDGMVTAWTAYHGIPVQPLALHTEGGNLWSDGQGTLIMSEQIFYSNRSYNRRTLEAYLHTVIDYDKLIITPRLTLEETGHVDLLVKLAKAATVFVSANTSATTYQALNKVKRLFERETNAQGMPYQVIELPTPPLYLNWVTYTIRRAYTNALTVNGRVLVPVYGIPEDDIALRTYEAAMPGFEIIPIESAVGINGGGAVHCMTKEVPG